MPSYQSRKSHCEDKTILRPFYLHNGISYTDKTTSLYWIRSKIVVHLVPDVSLPMDQATGNIVQGTLSGTMTTGASIVAAQVGNGLYTDGQKGHVDFGTHYTQCCHNPDMCAQGVTFAMWIKRGRHADDGIIFESGGTEYRTKGKFYIAKSRDYVYDIWRCNYLVWKSFCRVKSSEEEKIISKT